MGVRCRPLVKKRQFQNNLVAAGLVRNCVRGIEHDAQPTSTWDKIMSRQYPLKSLKYALVLSFVGMLAASRAIMPTPLALPGGESGIGFDDIGFAPSIQKVLVPAGRSGNLDLIDPDTKQVTAIGGFSRRASFGGGHGQGVTSADEGRGLLFATDRDAKRLDVVDPKTQSVIGTAPLASGPDYVRYVSTTGEVWVTEPSAARIEVFSLPHNGSSKPVHANFISIPGGPESLIIDNKRGRAYTHLWTDTTIAIDLKSRKVSTRWKNGCKGSRGMAMDDARGFLFVGCDEGKLTVLDMSTGAQLGQASSGDGVDIIAYNPRLAHAYLPGEGTMAIIGISDKGTATVLTTVKTADGAHCATADDRANAYVCDPKGGRLLIIKDFFSPSGE
jgi:DNA-binding beta-propeller fold protein YncE